MARSRAFTLVEVLIVVVILAIIAAIVVPRMSNASASARNTMLAENLRIMRTQLAVYRCQHRDVAAGYPAGGGAPDEAAFIEQLTKTTNEEGQAGAFDSDSFRFGPYMRKIPANPINDKDTVQMIGDDEPMPAAASGLFGWVYQPQTLTFRSDAAGEDENGKAYYDY